jgi:hypothetical protein
LKFFSEWFKEREESERHRFDYFYGPFSEQEAININRRRKMIMRSKLEKESEGLALVGRSAATS